MTAAEIIALITALAPLLTQLMTAIAAAIAAGNQPKATALQAMHDAVTSAFANAIMVK